MEVSFVCYYRMGGEQSEMNFCENKSLSMPTLRMTCEAKVIKNEPVRVKTNNLGSDQV